MKNIHFPMFPRKINRHYHEHIGFFMRIKSTMDKKSQEYLIFKDLEAKILKSTNGKESLINEYNKIWEIIFYYLSSPQFMQTI